MSKALAKFINDRQCGLSAEAVDQNWVEVKDQTNQNILLTRTVDETIQFILLMSNVRLFYINIDPANVFITLPEGIRSLQYYPYPQIFDSNSLDRIGLRHLGMVNVF